MLFLLTFILVFFVTVPGMYLIARCRLASSILEIVSTGFFFGFSLVVLTYISLSRVMSFHATDALVVASSAVCLVLLVLELAKQKLPWWLLPVGRVQPVLVLVPMIFMALLAFGDLSWHIDDDLFIHFPNIKRIAMGDIPPHVPYFPQSYLRGHTARVMFVGTLARFLDLRPELAVIYVTLSVVPFYILVFHTLSWRLARENRILTAYCFFGLLFLVSFAIGATAVRAGAITYVWNNNIFCYSHAVFIAWLIERTINAFARAPDAKFIDVLNANKFLIALCILAYTGLYFVYISNFLAFSLYLAALPFLLAIFSADRKVQTFVQTVVLICLIAIGTVLLHLIASPFLLERIMISLHMYQPAEPMGFIQQATLTFPKEHLFAICDPSGVDIPFLTRKSLQTQGLSFYLGLSALLIGFLIRRPTIAATALFGWVTMLWLLLVDMGSYRAETLRLMLIAHMAFGACTGLLIGCLVQFIFDNVDRKWTDGMSKTTVKIAVAAISAALCIWMAWGNVDKFMWFRHWDVAANVRKMKRIHLKDPENWNQFLNLRRIDFETFQMLQTLVHDPKETLLLKLAPDPAFKGDGHPINRLALMINAACMTGAGIVGVCQEHAPPHMSVDIFLYDYRASLFWQRPSVDLLQQLAPDWIVVDPKLISSQTFGSVLSMPGISKVMELSDNSGQRRLILQYTGPHFKAVPAGIDQVELEALHADSVPFGLVTIPATIKGDPPPDKVKIALMVIGEDGQTANTMDAPIVGVSRIGRNRFNLFFSMVQPGRWSVFFVDSASGKKLNEKPVVVEVKRPTHSG